VSLVRRNSVDPGDRTVMLPAMPGFEHVRRYWDPTRRIWAAKLLPGEYYVTPYEEIIVTVLGSCISACIRDPHNGYGGMNHFMLPAAGVTGLGAWHASDLDAATRYGNVAMERLINDLLCNGARREHLEVKVFGGAQIIEGMTDVGRRNIAFVNDYISTEGLKLLAQDVGSVEPRKIVFFSRSGKVMMKKLRSLANETVVQRERKYFEKVRKEPVQGEVDLF